MEFCFDHMSQVSGAGASLLNGRKIFLKSSVLLL